MNGYTHPAGALEFGKFSGQAYGLLIDEVRYSGELLEPDQFLRVGTDPGPPFTITDLTYDAGGPRVNLTFNSLRGHLYAVHRSFDLAIWDELSDSVFAPSDVTAYEDDTLPANAPAASYRVRELPAAP